ncbi:MAG: hypothetical protein JHC84_09350 [Solirubrobacteraceae bacterium]|nr:hypothetical protein [Solirubrobacteraceae bacterium]
MLSVLLTSVAVASAPVPATPAAAGPIRFAQVPVVLFARTEGTPRFNVIVRTTRRLPGGRVAARADLTVNGIGDPAPVTRIPPSSRRCAGLMMEGGNPETAEVRDGDEVSVALRILTKPRRTLRARASARKVSVEDLADDSGIPAKRWLRVAGCR